MTDVRAVTVFRPFGGNQLVFATNAVNPEGGAAHGYHPRHGNLLDAVPDRTNLSIIQIRGESFSLVQDNFNTALHQRECVPAVCAARQSGKAATGL
jgi:hypothetical protein